MTLSGRQGNHSPVAISPHVCLPSQLHSEECVFTDLGSLDAVASHWNEHIGTPILDYPQAAAQSLASGIECLILYERIVCDSMLLEVEPSINALTKHGLVTGVYLDEYGSDGALLTIRVRTARRVDETVQGIDDSVMTGMKDDDWHRAVSEDHFLDKRALESGIDYPHASPLLVPAALGDFAIQELAAETGAFVRHVPGFALRSNQTLARAIYHLELARELQLPYSPGRNRGQVLEAVLGEPTNGIPQTLLKRAMELRRIHREAGWKAVLQWSRLPKIYSGSFEVPTLAEYVINHSNKHCCTLGESIVEIRNSAAARKFRREMQRLTHLMLHDGRGEEELDRRLKTITEISRKWALDLDEDVVYRTRTVKLKDVPFIGKLLAAVGLDEWTTKDRVIWQSKENRGLIFLNDVLRAKNR